MEKFSVGDEVTIREDLDEGMDIEGGVISDMEQYRGKKAKITGYHHGSYFKLDVDGGIWCWSQDMFAEYVCEYRTCVLNVLDEALDGLELTKEERRVMEHVVLSEGQDTVKTICGVINKAKQFCMKGDSNGSD